MADIPTSEPVAFYQGDSVKWTNALPEYRAGDGWSLQYGLTGSSGGVTISAVASGDGFLVTLAAADTLAIQTQRADLFIATGTTISELQRSGIVGHLCRPEGALAHLIWRSIK